MTNYKTGTATGTMENKEQSYSDSLDLAVELMSAYITMIHEVKKLTDEMEISVIHSESVKSMLLKLAEEMETMRQLQQ